MAHTLGFVAAVLAMLKAEQTGHIVNKTDRADR
jgi:hypothetical protein